MKTTELRYILLLIMLMVILDAHTAEKTYRILGSLRSTTVSGREDVCIKSSLNSFRGFSENEFVRIQSGLSGFGNIDIPLGPEMEDIDDGLELPRQFKLYGNYPNPFNPETTISYDLPEESRVVIKIYKNLGQEVCTLINQRQNPGHRRVVWNGRNQQGESVSSGLYICLIEAGDFLASTKMILLK